ncbi:50S ribosomal protein L20 [Candidatus Roizmanbacteria bacterium RIFCSPHIGHO2_02_FULL_37_13b]|uniref:Large ribosomal subunit protein bL20 n=1 Tax=Candidatus Roizmanbacteria bacterium RIFCSPLOWO2_02_FULL_36_11 TaxID=1802071 RepID=A0A1F7JBZ4_9BACT|nr:MAG: 50S ribosomal protein L20 [Candidatus Roizmanbacteria bacterium RIFCSPHIGHO2_02_FULL_37_13b]OGK53134.1 MAG: 50S ribosomal protein L20 [Candidatus Roizmanbacteria bacterium RIFCSPLOWO2_02_FULL_36_11]
MARVKGGVTTRAKHKKILKQTKGYWMSRSKQIKKAKEAVLHAGEYAFFGRKLKKRQFRKLWIIRINAALSNLDLKYGKFINMLSKKNIIIDRKILAKLALEHPKIFSAIVKRVSD